MGVFLGGLGFFVFLLFMNAEAGQINETHTHTHKIFNKPLWSSEELIICLIVLLLHKVDFSAI